MVIPKIKTLNNQRLRRSLTLMLALTMLLARCYGALPPELSIGCNPLTFPISVDPA